MTVTVVIPARNEAEAIALVLREIPAGVVDAVFVVDGESIDGTAEAAAAAGARVIPQHRRGYGAACLEGALAAGGDVVVFLDGDYSDPPAALPAVLGPLLDGRADLVLGVRHGRVKEALPVHARAGNRVATLLIGLLFRRRVSDLPSFKAIRRDRLLALGVRDLHYGWTSELIARAVASNLRIVEVPIKYRPRIGSSKVSGNVRASIRAGVAILGAIVRVRLGR